MPQRRGRLALQHTNDLTALHRRGGPHEQVDLTVRDGDGIDRPTAPGTTVSHGALAESGGRRYLEQFAAAECGPDDVTPAQGAAPVR